MNISENISGKTFHFEEFGKLTRDNFWKIVDKEGLPLKKGVKELLAYGKIARI